MGMLTNKERYNQVIDIWGSTNNRLTELIYETSYEKTNKDLTQYI